MTRLRAKLAWLAKRYPPPQHTKSEYRILRLKEMRKFYEDKAPDAPVKQASLFYSYITALTYALHIIFIHKKLTKHLAELVEDEDETRLNS